MGVMLQRDVRAVRILTIVGAAFAVVTLVVYFVLMHRQGDQPAAWYVGILILGVALASIGLSERSPRLVPFAAAAFLILAGFLGILSIGLPALVGGWLVFAGAAVRVNVRMAGGSGSQHP